MWRQFVPQDNLASKMSHIPEFLIQLRDAAPLHKVEKQIRMILSKTLDPPDAHATLCMCPKQVFPHTDEHTSIHMETTQLYSEETR